LQKVVPKPLFLQPAGWEVASGSHWWSAIGFNL